MPETKRSSFRLHERTLQKIDEIRREYHRRDRYDRATMTAVIERAVDRLHRLIVAPLDPAPHRPDERDRP